MGLHTTRLGQSGSPVVFCHGLFGQGKNWTQIAKALADDHRVTLFDMPNHGRSDWVDEVDYEQMAGLVGQELTDLDQGPVALVGHSMGGKVAMLVALHRPELVERLCVVDVSPVTYDHADEFRRYMDAMLRVAGRPAGRRADVDEALSEAVPNTTVRAFLMQNLHRSGSGDDAEWTWRPNLEVLRRDLEVLGGWPAQDTTYDGQVLWVAGADSPYITDDYADSMESLFPRVRKVVVKNAGHWVHSQQPEVFTEIVRRFVDAAST